MGLKEDCWIWKACRQNKGYGITSRGGRMRLAHRVIYELLVGPIPRGLELDHICRQRGCVNPDHLRPCTRKENLNAPGSKVLLNGRYNAIKTHCPQGHPYAGDNLWLKPRGYGDKMNRICRTCRRVQDKRYRMLRTAQVRAKTIERMEQSRG